MRKGTSIIAVIIIIVIILVAAFLILGQGQKIKIDPNEELSEDQVTQLIEAVGVHIMLPADEEPLVATIVNIEDLLAEQPFYQGAENGDILMIFGAIGKALIYSPSRDKLINVGPVDVQPSPEGLEVVEGGETIEEVGKTTEVAEEAVKETAEETPETE